MKAKTVGELIAVLQGLPGDAELNVHGDGDGVVLHPDGQTFQIHPWYESAMTPEEERQWKRDHPE